MSAAGPAAGAMTAGGQAAGAMTAAGPASEPEVVPDQPDELARGRCWRCGAVGTHYLTCPDLRLPSGFRFGEPGGSATGR
jgi:hypothetical protein